MSKRTFKTSEVLAAIHSFPTVMAAREGIGIIEAFDRLRDLSPQMAGVEYGQNHLSWCTLSQSLVPVLREHFSAMAAETFPDKDYWSGSKKSIDPQKVEAMKGWVIQMEHKYGARIEVPDISGKVLQQLELRS